MHLEAIMNGIFTGALVAPLALALAMSPGQGSTTEATSMELFERLLVAFDQPVEPCLSNTCGVAGVRCMGCTRFLDADQDFRALVQRLVSGDSAWATVGPTIESALRSDTRSASVHEGLLNLVAYAPCPDTMLWAERLWNAAPNRFADAHLIALAELGSERFLERIVERASEASVPCAAYLAHSGDRRGESTLALALGEETDSTAIALAGAGLRDLGQVSGWQRALERMRAVAVTHLDAYELEAARRITLETEYLIGCLGGASPSPMDYSSGGWWGFDSTSPMWIWRPGAADRLRTELRFNAQAKRSWNPGADEILARIESLAGPAESLLDHIRGFEIEASQRLEPGLLDSAAQVVAEASAYPMELVRASKGYAARIVDPRSGQALDAQLLLVPLPAPLQGGWIAVASDDRGDVVALDLFGAATFEGDCALSWGVFLNQFFANPSIGTTEYRQHAEPPARAGDLERHLQALSSDDATLARALIEERQLMKSNRLFLGQLQETVMAGGDVDPAWIEAQALAFRRLAERAQGLAPLLREQALRSYREQASRAAEILEQLASFSANESLTQTNFRAQAGDLGHSCAACHFSTSPAKKDRQQYLAGRRAQFDLPRGLFLLGYDVAPAPGLSTAQAQHVATALRVGLLFASLVRN